MFGFPPGQGVNRGPRVPGQGRDGGVAALGHEHRRRQAILGKVRQRRMPQLVQGRAAGGGLEQVLRLPVRQPGPAAGEVDIARRQLDAGPAVGQEQRPGLAALQEGPVWSPRSLWGEGGGWVQAGTSSTCG